MRCGQEAEGAVTITFLLLSEENDVGSLGKGQIIKYQHQKTIIIVHDKYLHSRGEACRVSCI